MLVRFEKIIGDGPGQIPPGSTVLSATLIVSAFDQGDTVHIHRMLVPWQRQATWATLVAGITADGNEASRHRESFTFGKIAANSSTIPFNVTDSVQAWVNGAANHGWVFINTGGNGWDFYTSEFDDVKQRPRMLVEYTRRANGLQISDNDFHDSPGKSPLSRARTVRLEELRSRWQNHSPGPGMQTPRTSAGRAAMP